MGFAVFAAGWRCAASMKVAPWLAREPVENNINLNPASPKLPQRSVCFHDRAWCSSTPSRSDLLKLARDGGGVLLGHGGLLRLDVLGSLCRCSA
jgi:hypothetical protein